MTPTIYRQFAPTIADSPARKIGHAVTFVFFLAIGLALVGWLSAGFEKAIQGQVIQIALLSLLAGVILTALRFVGYLTAFRGRMLRALEGLGQIEVKMNSAGIECKCQTQRSFYDWTAVKRVVPVRKGLGLDLGYGFIALPAAGIHDGDDFGRVANQIENWRDAKAQVRADG